MSRARVVTLGLAGVAGIALGIGSYTFVYARGAACRACHADIVEALPAHGAGGGGASAATPRSGTCPDAAGRGRKDMNGRASGGRRVVVELTDAITDPAVWGKNFPRFQRRAHSTGFHAPQEAARVLGISIALVRQGQLALRDAARR